MFTKLFLLGTVVAIAQAFSDPCAGDRLPISEESGILGFCATGAWTPALDENNVALLNNTQLKLRTLVKLAPGELVVNNKVRETNGLQETNGLNVVWNSVETSEDGNKLVIDWFSDYGGPQTLDWSETYSMYTQPQYEGNWVDENNPNKQFIHYFMGFEATADPNVYTLVGAVSDMFYTEWTVTFTPPTDGPDEQNNVTETDAPTPAPTSKDDADGSGKGGDSGAAAAAVSSVAAAVVAVAAALF